MVRQVDRQARIMFLYALSACYWSASVRIGETGVGGGTMDMGEETIPAPVPTGLDPADWRARRTLGHRMLDEIFEQIATRGTAPVWRPMPETVCFGLRADINALVAGVLAAIGRS